MKRLALSVVFLLAGCGLSGPAASTSPTVAPTSHPSPNLGMTVGEFQDRWNAEFDDLVDAGLDALVMTDVQLRDTTFEARLSPVVRISGTTDSAGLVTAVEVWYSGEKGGIGSGSIDDGLETLDAVYAFETLPSVVIKSMPSGEANDILLDMGWPDPDEGLEGIDLEGERGGVHFTVTDEGQSGIRMTAALAAP